MSRKHLVISAVNINEGGTLTVFRECLRVAHRDLSVDWDITAIVHSADIVGVPGIRYVERPEIKKRWLSRVWFEYFQCKALSRELKADFWLAMHDMSPRVVAPRQAVYCHNPMCFYRINFRESLLDPKLLLFSLFYSYLYGLNIKANEAVIVQQDWIRAEFQRRYTCPNVIVAHPVLESVEMSVSKKRGGLRFFYPSFPRIFKNFDVLLQAWSLLSLEADWHGQLLITVDGTENAYARGLMKRFGHLRNVTFSGRLTHSQVQEEYERSDCLVFPSRLETWGMPLSEAKLHGLAIIVADLPYAHEAIGEYDGVSFFQENDPAQLAEQMRLFSQGKLPLQTVQSRLIADPHANDWSNLFRLLLAQST